MSSSGHRTSRVLIPDPHVEEQGVQGVNTHSIQGLFKDQTSVKQNKISGERKKTNYSFFPLNDFTSLQDSTSSGLKSVQRASSTKVDVVIS